MRLSSFIKSLVVGLVIGYFGGVGLEAYTDSQATHMPGDLKATDLKLGGNDILDSDGTTRVTVGATNAVTGAVTVSGNSTLGDAVTDTVTFTGLPTLPGHATPVASVTPTAAR